MVGWVEGMGEFVFNLQTLKVALNPNTCFPDLCALVFILKTKRTLQDMMKTVFIHS